MLKVEIKVDRRRIDLLARRFPEITAAAMEEMLDESGDVLSKEIERLTRERVGRAGRGGTGSYIEGHRIKLSRGGYRKIKIELTNSAPHAYYVENGRKKGKMPPIQPIQLWASRVLGDGRRGTAFAIARTIAKRGVPAKHIYRDALARSQARLDRIARSLGERILRRLG